MENFVVKKKKEGIWVKFFLDKSQQKKVWSTETHWQVYHSVFV